MKYRIKEQFRMVLLRGLLGLFLVPLLVMVCWGAFVHMTDFGLSTITYWQAFMLNIVAMMFRGTPISEWIIEEQK